MIYTEEDYKIDHQAPTKKEAYELFMEAYQNNENFVDDEFMNLQELAEIYNFEFTKEQKQKIGEKLLEDYEDELIDYRNELREKEY